MIVKNYKVVLTKTAHLAKHPIFSEGFCELESISILRTSYHVNQTAKNIDTDVSYLIRRIFFEIFRELIKKQFSVIFFFAFEVLPGKRRVFDRNSNRLSFDEGCENFCTLNTGHTKSCFRTL